MIEPREQTAPNAEKGDAPGAPGEPPRWADGRKTSVGTAIARTCRVWFSTANGIVTEVFYPAPDRACIRELSFVVTADDSFVSEEERDTSHLEGTPLTNSPPVGVITNTCLRGRYRLEKEIIAEPLTDVLMLRVRFVVTAGEPSTYRLFCVLQPHLGDDGNDSTAYVEEHKGIPVLSASSPGPYAVALACSTGWGDSSAGFVGTSDGRRTLRAHRTLTDRYRRAAGGNVVLVGEIDHQRSGGEVTLALGFGQNRSTAAHLALGGLLRGFESAKRRFVSEWEAWSANLAECRVDGKEPSLWTRSATVLKTLESKGANGGRVAALSTPWGTARGPGIDGTYHLVWTRDLVQCVSGLVAAGADREAKRILFYLRCTQELDGHWPQNLRLDGDSFWDNNELDEAALPVLLLHLLRRERLLTLQEQRDTWPMVRSAASFIAQTGPATVRDRWEDVCGLTPFTLAAAIAGLLMAADIADLNAQPVASAYLRDLADEWNDAIEPWLYRQGGALAEHVGVPGYYVRARSLGEPLEPKVNLASLPRTEVSPDALALVRFGLRAADDPRMVDTVRVIDAVLKRDFAGGPAWRRYPGDEYGEYDDGAPFDGHGVGRSWPLFTGERAHYELALGRADRAAELLRAMESLASPQGYLPEQVWDGLPLAKEALMPGSPTGSANPLGWAHAEYLTLCRSVMDGRVFDTPHHARERYVLRSTPSRFVTWRPGEASFPLEATKTLRVVCLSPAEVSWSLDGWVSRKTVGTTDTGMGIHYVDVAPTAAAPLRLCVHHEAGTQGSDAEHIFEPSLQPRPPTSIRL